MAFLLKVNVLSTDVYYPPEVGTTWGRSGWSPVITSLFFLVSSLVQMMVVFIHFASTMSPGVSSEPPIPLPSFACLPIKKVRFWRIRKLGSLDESTRKNERLFYHIKGYLNRINIYLESWWFSVTVRAGNGKIFMIKSVSIKSIQYMLFTFHKNNSSEK